MEINVHHIVDAQGAQLHHGRARQEFIHDIVCNDGADKGAKKGHRCLGTSDPW